MNKLVVRLKDQKLNNRVGTPAPKLPQHRCERQLQRRGYVAHRGQTHPINRPSGKVRSEHHEFPVVADHEELKRQDPGLS